MKTYTVDLMYPDYADPWPQMYTTSVEAESPEDASEQAKQIAYRANDEWVESPDDFRCNAVYEGELAVLYSELP